jgi:Cu(I)/Ag(I) efflux system protein CusF
MNKLLSIAPLAAALALTALVAPPVQAASHAGAAPTAMADLADGEVRKVDKDTQKITLKHGEIKSLDMPSMTMLFRVKDPAMLDQVKVGDKVKFKAEKSGGAITLTEIQVVR